MLLRHFALPALLVQPSDQNRPKTTNRVSAKRDHACALTPLLFQFTPSTYIRHGPRLGAQTAKCICCVTLG